MTDRDGQPRSSADAGSPAPESPAAGPAAHLPAHSGARPTIRQALRQCAPSGVVAARRGQADMAVARLPTGEAFALPDHCPHAGVPLSEGFVEDGQLVCPMHGWAFDLASGRCVNVPGVTIPVTRLEQRPSRRSRGKPGVAADVTGQQSLDLSGKA